MIKTIIQPRHTRGGVIDCEGCDARLEYEANDVHATMAPGWRTNWPGAPANAKRFFITCPHCQKEIQVKKTS